MHMGRTLRQKCIWLILHSEWPSFAQMLAQTGPAQFANAVAAKSGLKTIANTFLRIFFLKFIRFFTIDGSCIFCLNAFN